MYIYILISSSSHNNLQDLRKIFLSCNQAISHKVKKNIKIYKTFLFKKDGPILQSKIPLAHLVLNSNFSIQFAL